MAGRDGPEDSQLIDVARVVGVHGVRGALRVRLHDEESTALQVGLAVSLCRPDGEVVETAVIERVAPKPGSHLVRVWLEGIESREAADALRELEVRIPRSSLPPLDEDEYYLADAIGLSVLDDGRSLGTVVGVTTNNAQDLFEVEWASVQGKTRRWLLPALPEFVTGIDERGVHVDLPPGMLPTELELEREQAP
jgi:16S rRNA processing protein RimM